MCNLYDIGPGAKRISGEMEKIVAEALHELQRPLNLRPTNTGLVIRKDDGELVAQTMRWGFDRPFNSAITNARNDKLDGGMWRKAWRERRCLIPVAAYYEWNGPRGQKQTYAMRREDGHWLWMAGVFEYSEAHGACYSMVTTEPNDQLVKIHNRMPAILTGDPATFLKAEDPLDRIAPYPEKLELFPCQNPLKMKATSPPIEMEVQGELF